MRIKYHNHISPSFPLHHSNSTDTLTHSQLSHKPQRVPPLYVGDMHNNNAHFPVAHAACNILSLLRISQTKFPSLAYSLVVLGWCTLYAYERLWAANTFLHGWQVYMFIQIQSIIAKHQRRTKTFVGAVSDCVYCYAMWLHLACLRVLCQLLYIVCGVGDMSVVKRFCFWIGGGPR